MADGIMNVPATDEKFDKKIDYSEISNDEQKHKIQPMWVIIIVVSYLHLGSLYGLYLVFTSAKIATTLFAILLYQLNVWGILAGAHRLWSHRAYKAKWPLRLLLVIIFTCAYQHSVINWARNHLVHHKFSDTNADPYNTKRGFFFAHVGWLLIKKHPDVVNKGKQIDISNLYDDPLLKYQHKYIGSLSAIFGFILPTIIPMYFWHETFTNSFYVAAALRWTLAFNALACINSVAHKFGNKPYDNNLSAVQNMTMSFLVGGEGWHNYHHAFPWDYQASEMGSYFTNSTTAFIDFFAWIGWAYDLKAVSPDIMQKRIVRTGDGSHPVWGSTDKDLLDEDRLGATTLSPSK